MKYRLSNKNVWLSKINHKSFSKFILSFILSFIFIWLLSYFFYDSSVTYDYDPALKQYIVTPDFIYKHRSEGSGTSHYGKYNISSIADVTKTPLPKIAIWGDSYVEAFHVNDNEKLAQVATSLYNSTASQKILFMGIGLSGDNIADYYFSMPKYEKIIPSIMAHFIIITNFDDTLPDVDSSRGVFRSNPYRLEENVWEPRSQKIKKMLNKYNLSFIWATLKSLSMYKIRFVPGVSATALFPKAPDFPYKNSNEAWSFLLEKLKDQSKLPIILVYCPEVPRIAAGEILFSDQHSDIAQEFSKECLKHGIGFINVSNDFIAYYKTTGKFPRGFPNTLPAGGHFNAQGHRIVANAIVRYTKKIF